MDMNQKHHTLRILGPSNAGGGNAGDGSQWWFQEGSWPHGIGIGPGGSYVAMRFGCQEVSTHQLMDCHFTSHHIITSHHIQSHHIIWFCCVMLLDIRRLSDRYATAIRWLSDGYPMALIMAFQQTADGNWAAIRRLSDGYPRQTRQPYF